MSLHIIEWLQGYEEQNTRQPISLMLSGDELLFLNPTQARVVGHALLAAARHVDGEG